MVHVELHEFNASVEGTVTRANAANASGAHQPVALLVEDALVDEFVPRAQGAISHV